MRLIAFVTDGGSITRILGPPREEDFDTLEGETFAVSEPLPEYAFDQWVSW